MFQINSFDLSEVLAYFFLWTTLYFILCICDSSHSFEWHCRAVTAIHAVVISSLAAYCTFVIGPWPFTDAGGPNSPMQIRTVSLCLSYFLFDITWCMYFKTEGPAMVAHHSISIIGTLWCLLSGYYGTEIVATIGGAEITNPLLQLRWFLRESGKRDTLLFDVVEWAFMVLFVIFRFGFGSVMLYSYYQQDTDFWGRLGGTGIYLIGWVFFFGIVNYTINKYKRRNQNLMSRSELQPATDNSVSYKGDSKNEVEDEDKSTQGKIKHGRNGEVIQRNNYCTREL